MITDRNPTRKEFQTKSVRYKIGKQSAVKITKSNVIFLSKVISSVTDIKHSIRTEILTYNTVSFFFHKDVQLNLIIILYLILIFRAIITKM